MAEYVTCSKCGKLQELHYCNNADLIKHQLCFSCDFWRQVVEDFHNPKYEHKIALCNGNAYYVGDENSTSYFRGFGGRHVTITFNDGTVVETTNLWSRGDIPSSFKEELPENCTMVWGY